MKVSIVHHSYKQSGTEDVAVAHEAALLRLAGHEVIEYQGSNRNCSGGSSRRRPRATYHCVLWNVSSFFPIGPTRGSLLGSVICCSTLPGS